MKALRTYCTLAALLLWAVPATAQDFDLPRPSPKASVTQTIGLTEMSISYSRPGVKGRVIWGELVPYDEIWRTGANEATTFKTSDAILVEGRQLPAGSYALFTIPGKDTWQVVFNSQAEQWGAFSHDASKDVVKLELRPKMGVDHVEWMRFTFDNMTTTTGELTLRWERLELPIRIEVSLEKVQKDISAAMASYDGKNWRTPYRCASFYFEHDLDFEQAKKWNEMSLEVEENYFNTRLMALLQAQAGDRKKAVMWGEKAIKLGKERENPIDTRPVERMIAEWRND